jgi:hypothetical protein
MATSAWKLRSNQQNARKSTGPRTQAGKAVSRKNALQHGLRAVFLIGEETSPEIEQERKDWIRAFEPNTKAGLQMTDWSFRCRRLLEHVNDAYDASIARNLADAVNNFLRERKAQIDQAMEQLREDTFSAHLTLSSTVAGCQRLIELIDKAEIELDEGRWNEECVSTLMVAIGLAPESRDPEISQWTRRLENPDPRGSLSEQAEVEQAILGLRDRIQVCRELIEERIEELGDEEKRSCEIAYHMAKVDLSREGQLRHRYLNEAHRRFLKYFDLACRARKGEIQLSGPDAELGFDFTRQDDHTQEADHNAERPPQRPAAAPRPAIAPPSATAPAEQSAPTRAVAPPKPASQPGQTVATSQKTGPATTAPNEPKIRSAASVNPIGFAADQGYDYVPISIGGASASGPKR